MRFIFSVVVFLAVSVCSAQLKHPKASPSAKVVQEIGFTTITVDYSRPAVNGRKIFGDLVPYGSIWRVGANESTKITFDTDVQLFGDTLSKGTYALYAFPDRNEWQIVFHKNITHWGDGRDEYNSEEDALRVKAVPKADSAFQENFLIYFDQLTHDSANMVLHWASTRVSVPLHFGTKETMEKQIEQKLKSQPSAQTYYEIARYYIEEDVQHEVALQYVDKAIALSGNTYYFYRIKSLAEAKLQAYETAIKSAKKSLKLADELGKDEFVRMNQKNIDLWTKKAKSKK